MVSKVLCYISVSVIVALSLVIVFFLQSNEKFLISGMGITSAVSLVLMRRDYSKLDEVKDRLKNNRCYHCNYPLPNADMPCPECGKLMGECENDYPY